MIVRLNALAVPIAPVSVPTTYDTDRDSRIPLLTALLGLDILSTPEAHW
jgi:hypothetical protein